VFASINYRLSPPGGTSTFPAHIQDAKCAVRHLRHDALNYRIDPTRIGTWGHSAGGHLAALLGTVLEETFEPGEYVGTSSSVQAVVPQAAITDLTRRDELICIWPEHEDDCLLVSVDAAFPGAAGSPAIAANWSPIGHADTGDPPFFLLHGALDQYVSPNQAHRLYELLGGSDNGHQIEIVADAIHSFAVDEATQSVIADWIADFFDQHLGN
jgi:acetyl esterase/lipase